MDSQHEYGKMEETVEILKITPVGRDMNALNNFTYTDLLRRV
jgi:hypothetical protein